MDFLLTNGAGTADLPLTLIVSDFATAPGGVTVDATQASPLVTWTAPTTVAGDPVASYTITATSQGGTPYTFTARRLGDVADPDRAALGTYS